MTTNPLSGLDAWWEAAYDDGGSDTRIISFSQRGKTARLDFATDDDAMESAEWTLEIEGCLESVWRNDRSSLEWFAEHPLLARFNDGHGWISFSRPLPDPLRAWGAAAQAHEEAVGDWTPFAQYLRPSMFDANFGILAEGPARILAAYERALHEVGADVAMASRQKPYGFHDPQVPLSVVTWGTSYFVASLFRLIRNV